MTPPLGGEWVTTPPLGGGSGEVCRDGVRLSRLVYIFIIHVSIITVQPHCALSDGSFSVTDAGASRLPRVCVPRRVDGLEDACERVVAVLLDGH